MSLEEDLLAIETELWTGGPEAYRKHTDDECLVVFAEMAGTMSREDIAKTAEKGRWKDVKMHGEGPEQALQLLRRDQLRVPRPRARTASRTTPSSAAATPIAPVAGSSPSTSRPSSEKSPDRERPARSCP